MNQAIVTKKVQVCGPMVEVQAGRYRAHIRWDQALNRIENHRAAFKAALLYKGETFGQPDEWVAGDISGDEVAWVRMPRHLTHPHEDVRLVCSNAFNGPPAPPIRQQLMPDHQRKIAEGNELFMELLNGPNPLTPEEIDTFCDKRPQWERFRAFGAKAKAAKGGGNTNDGN